MKHPDNFTPPSEGAVATGHHSDNGTKGPGDKAPYVSPTLSGKTRFEYVPKGLTCMQNVRGDSPPAKTPVGVAHESPDCPHCGAAYDPASSTEVEFHAERACRPRWPWRCDGGKLLDADGREIAGGLTMSQGWRILRAARALAEEARANRENWIGVSADINEVIGKVLDLARTPANPLPGGSR